MARQLLRATAGSDRPAEPMDEWILDWLVGTADMLVGQTPRAATEPTRCRCSTGPGRNRIRPGPDRFAPRGCARTPGYGARPAPAGLPGAASPRSRVAPERTETRSHWVGSVPGSGFHAVWVSRCFGPGRCRSAIDSCMHPPLNIGETTSVATAEKGGMSVNAGSGVACSAGVSGRTLAVIRQDAGKLFVNGGVITW